MAAQESHPSDVVPEPLFWPFSGPVAMSATSCGSVGLRKTQIVATNIRVTGAADVW
jgi:hypothetical protein